MTLLHHLFLLTLLCLLSNALTTLIPSQNLTNLTNYDFDCIPKPTRWSKKVPDFGDCIDALNLLPTYEKIDTFHNGPPNNPYRLPVEKTVKSCTVSVEMVHEGSTTEAGSWQDLWHAAVECGRECLQDWVRPAPSAGAWVWFGKHRRIVVTLRYYEVLDEGINVEVA